MVLSIKFSLPSCSLKWIQWLCVMSGESLRQMNFKSIITGVSSFHHLYGVFWVIVLVLTVRPKSHSLSVQLCAEADSQLVKFCSPQNISGASQQRSFPAFSQTTEVGWGFVLKLKLEEHKMEIKLIQKDVIYTFNALSSSSAKYWRGAR